MIPSFFGGQERCPGGLPSWFFRKFPKRQNWGFLQPQPPRFLGFPWPKAHREYQGLLAASTLCWHGWSWNKESERCLNPNLGCFDSQHPAESVDDMVVFCMCMCIYIYNTNLFYRNDPNIPDKLEEIVTFPTFTHMNWSINREDMPNNHPSR